MKFALGLIVLSSITAATASTSIDPKTVTCKVYDSTKVKEEWPWNRTESNTESEYEITKKVLSNNNGVWEGHFNLKAANEEIEISVSAYQASVDPHVPVPQEVVFVRLFDSKKQVESNSEDSYNATLNYTRLAMKGSADSHVYVKVQCELQ